MARDFVTLLRIMCNVKLLNLFISGIFHLIVLDCDWPWVTENMESKTVGKGKLLYIHSANWGLHYQG